MGTDAFHTPEWLVTHLERAFVHVCLSVARDRPYEGTMVPLEFLGRDKRVDSVMIEVRRGLYCDEETGEPFFLVTRRDDVDGCHGQGCLLRVAATRKPIPENRSGRMSKANIPMALSKRTSVAISVRLPLFPSMA